MWQSNTFVSYKGRSARLTVESTVNRSSSQKETLLQRTVLQWEYISSQVFRVHSIRWWQHATTHQATSKELLKTSTAELHWFRQVHSSLATGSWYMPQWHVSSVVLQKWGCHRQPHCILLVCCTNSSSFMYFSCTAAVVSTRQGKRKKKEFASTSTWTDR